QAEAQAVPVVQAIVDFAEAEVLGDGAGDRAEVAGGEHLDGGLALSGGRLDSRAAGTRVARRVERARSREQAGAGNCGNGREVAAGGFVVEEVERLVLHDRA